MGLSSTIGVTRGTGACSRICCKSGHFAHLKADEFVSNLTSKADEWPRNEADEWPRTSLKNSSIFPRSTSNERSLRGNPDPAYASRLRRGASTQFLGPCVGDPPISGSANSPSNPETARRIRRQPVKFPVKSTNSPSNLSIAEEYTKQSATKRRKKMKVGLQDLYVLATQEN